MTDLLTPEEVRGIILNRRSTSKKANANAARLCRDYLTLWERNEKLTETIGWYEAKHPND